MVPGNATSASRLVCVSLFSNFLVSGRNWSVHGFGSGTIVEPIQPYYPNNPFYIYGMHAVLEYACFQKNLRDFMSYTVCYVYLFTYISARIKLMMCTLCFYSTSMHACMCINDARKLL